MISNTIVRNTSNNHEMWHVRSGSAIEIGPTGKPLGEINNGNGHKRNRVDKMIDESPTRVHGSTLVQQSIFTDTHPRKDAYNGNVELPFEELGSQRASNNSYGSPRYQKKAPRKKNNNNYNKKLESRGDENVFTTDHDGGRGSKQDLESGNE
jgi:hypothetical protein